MTASEFLADIFREPPGEAGPCPSAADLAAYAEGELPSEDGARVEDHVHRCGACAELVERLVEAASAAPLPFPVHVPDLQAMRARRRPAEGFALAANSSPKLPEVLRIDDLLPGFQGEATGDGCSPSVASTLRLARTAPEAEPPPEVLAVWPTEQTMPRPFTHRAGRWRAEIRLPLPWPETVELLQAGEIRLELLPPGL